MSYKEKRDELMQNIASLIEEEKVDEANEMMKEVEKLDAMKDQQDQAMANMRALQDQERKVNIQNFGAVNAQVVDKTIQNIEDAKEVYKTDMYLNAWAKMMTGKALSNDEAKAFTMVNSEGSSSASAYTHTTGNTGILIPETVANGIWKEVGERHPFYADTMKTFVQGAVSIIVAQSSTEAKWYVESVKTEDGTELFNKTTLNGCELARAISVSWKLKEMAIADFIPYITSAMAEEMGKALGYGMLNGAGVRSGHAPEPTGLVTALLAEEDTPQVATYTASAGITFADLIAARALVKSGYTPAVYVNAKTMWTQLAAMVDSTGRPLLMADATSSDGVYRLLGCVVKEEDGMSDGEILFSDAKQYQVNINKQVNLTTEEHNKERITDYCAYAIVDGAPITLKAHALLKAGE